MSDLRDTIPSNSEISDDEMEENSSISSEEEGLENEGKGYTCESEYSKDELIKLGIDVLEEKNNVSSYRRQMIAMIVMNLIQVDVKIYIGVHALTVALCQPSSDRSYRFILLQENRRLLR